MIVVNDEQVKRANDLLSHIPNGANTALSRAINRAAEMARTDAVRKATSEYIISASRVRETIKINKSSPSRLVASVVSRDYAVGLENFRVYPMSGKFGRNGPTLRVQVKKDGAMKPLPHAFVLRQSNGKSGVFERVVHGGRRVGRFPIEKKFGPAVPVMLGTDRVRSYVEEKAMLNIDKRLEHEIDRMLK